MDNIEYKMLPDGRVKIVDGLSMFTVDKHDCEKTLATIDMQKDNYLTEKHYLRHRAKFEGALNLMRSVNG